jgi:uncharacterized membrane protein YeaQ/YmgE (transglycosylase-associated protein family)
MGTVAWILTVVLAGFTGWVAEKLMRRDLGVIGTIVLGVVGGVLLNAILRGLGIVQPGMWAIQSLTAIVGSAALIAAWRFYRAAPAGEP